MAGKKNDVCATAAPEQGFSLISNEKLLQLYAAMVNCRKLAERARKQLPQSRLTEDTVGCEAVAVGAAIELLPEDTVVAMHQGFLFEFIQGAPLEEIIGRLLALPALTRRNSSVGPSLLLSPIRRRSTKKLL
jgi:TPP-dependent pyruvate/acetoin dehydrogenase alpha subunit